MTARKQLADSMAANALKRASITQPPVDPLIIADAFGVRVAQVEPPSPDISGFLLREDPDTGKPAIGVNRKHSAVRRRFTIAHELGHLILEHPGDYKVDNAIVSLRNSDSSSGEIQFEIEANQFAAALLMPEPWLTDEYRRDPFDIGDDTRLKRLARRYGVSTQAMTFRLVNLHLIE